MLVVFCKIRDEIDQSQALKMESLFDTVGEQSIAAAQFQNMLQMPLLQ